MELEEPTSDSPNMESNVALEVQQTETFDEECDETHDSDVIPQINKEDFEGNSDHEDTGEPPDCLLAVYISFGRSLSGLCSGSRR